MSATSEYERRRLENIARNQDLLKDLQLNKVSVAMPTKKRPSKSFEPVAEDNTKRRSLRVQRKDPDGVGLPELPAQPGPVDSEWNLPRLVGELPVALTGFDDDAANKSAVSFASQLSQLDSTRSSKAVKSSWNAKWLETPPQSDPLRVHPRSAALKVCRNRIYSMCFHPGADSMLVAVGDKSGCIGFFDASADLDLAAKSAIDPSSVVLRFSPHVKPVSSLRFDASSRLLSASYDGSVRRTDLRAGGVCQEVYVHPQEENLHCVCPAEVGADNTYYVCDGKGGMALIDVRQSVEQNAASIKVMSTHKIGCVDLNSSNPNLISTASNNGNASIFDVRKWAPKSSLADFEHDKACTSARFSPSGHALLTTSYDNTCRVFTADDKSSWDSAGRVLRHDNETGRWITHFEALWITDATFLIGNMRRKLDVFSLSSRSSAPYSCSHDELVTSIPAVNCVHPVRPYVASGNASGKVYLWSINK
jgi:hypothetical protein